MVSLGISPEYVLNRMSVGAMSAVLNAETEKIHKAYEIARIGWFYSNTASGLSKVQAPEELIAFPWDNKVKKAEEGRKLTKGELKDKEEKARQWLEKTKHQ
jgi:hypothetical protein